MQTHSGMQRRRRLYTPRTLALPPPIHSPTPPLSSMRTQPQNGANPRQRRTSLPSPPISLSLSVFCLRRCLHYLGQVGREKSTEFFVYWFPLFDGFPGPNFTQPPMWCATVMMQKLGSRVRNQNKAPRASFSTPLSVLDFP